MKYNIDDIIRDGEIHIPKSLWSELNNNLNKEEIKTLISNAIEDRSISLPYRKITRKEAYDDFLALKSLDTSSLLKKEKFFTRYDYNHELHSVYIENSRIGNKASDFFHQKSRFMCDSINSPSPYRTWTNHKFRMTLLNSLWTLKLEEVNSTKLRSCIGLRKYIASQFRPSAAKCIYDTFKSKSILDFSSGWGDRLCGFNSSNTTESYFGIDPNEGLFEGYNLQQEFYGTDKDVKIICSPAEEVEFSYVDKFDTIFTSPPYFNIERYSRGETQSWVRYKKLEDWMTNFMIKTLESIWPQLNTGGYLILNISDVYSNHQVNMICNPMNDFIEQKLKGQYKGCWGLKMAKRPNSKACDESGVFGEPIWIWRKK